MRQAKQEQSDPALAIAKPQVDQLIVFPMDSGVTFFSSRKERISDLISGGEIIGFVLDEAAAVSTDLPEGSTLKSTPTVLAQAR